jgi:uncharacterized FlaG/YvyC family protein
MVVFIDNILQSRKAKKGGEKPMKNGYSEKNQDMHERHARISDALNKALEALCCHNELSLNRVMSNGLQPIADALETDSIVVYRQVEHDGKKRFRHRKR